MTRKIEIVQNFELIKSTCKKLQLTLYSVIKNWILPPNIDNKARIPNFTVYIQHSAGNCSQSSKTRQDTQNAEEEMKLPLFTYDLIVYIKKNKNKNLSSMQTNARFRIQYKHIKT